MKSIQNSYPPAKIGYLPYANRLTLEFVEAVVGQGEDILQLNVSHNPRFWKQGVEAV